MSSAQAFGRLPQVFEHAVSPAVERHVPSAQHNRQDLKPVEPLPRTARPTSRHHHHHLVGSETTSKRSPSPDAPQVAVAPPLPEAEENRCWICHGTESEDKQDAAAATATTVAVHGDWRKPCKCALVAHEKCLLEWIADLQANPQRAGRRIRCPQCRTEIRLRQKDSTVLKVLNGVAKVADASVPVFIVCGLGSMLFIGATVYGVKTVYLMCGSELANEVLMGSDLSTVNWTWRLGFGLPLIPLILVGSRTRYLDAALPILPFVFLSHADPLHLTFPPSPTVTLALLPYVRGIYNSLWEKYVEPMERRWARAGLPAASQAAEEQREQEQRQQHVRLQHNRRNRAVQGGVRVEHEWNAEIRLDNRSIDGSSLTKTIVGALLFPGISAAVGYLLGKFPFLRNRLPSAFQRNILGGCLFVLLKDLIRLYYNYKRAKQMLSREVLNYEKRFRRSQT